MYKPVAGERPLWDFPDGTLAEREVAAYEVSAATGWRHRAADRVPRRAARARHGAALDRRGRVCRRRRCCSDARDNGALRRIAVFDAVINNADRKGGHLLPVTGGHVYGVDHGVSFHVEDKLRTVLWQWAGKPLPPDCLEVLAGCAPISTASSARQLQQLLTAREVRRTRRRVDSLLSAGQHPRPSDDWPPMPWPPF